MIGKTLSHYKVLEKIGQGGMGEVYRAEDTSLKREVAIKVLPEQFTKDPQRLARFEREASRILALPGISSGAKVSQYCAAGRVNDTHTAGSETSKRLWLWGDSDKG